MPQPNKRPQATISATPRNGVMGSLADALLMANSGIDKNSQNMQQAGLPDPLGMLKELLSAPAIANTLNSISYGSDLTTGKGFTTQMNPDTRDALLAVLPGANILRSPAVLNRASKLGSKYADVMMTRQPAFVNIEATGPKILQRANETPLGLQLSDVRYQMAQQGARKKNMAMADSDVTIGQGVWVDPKNGTEEFNRVYSQNIGRLPESDIANNQNLKSYAESMGSDLQQIGVGAGRFSEMPFGLGKEFSTGVKYDAVSPQAVIDAGRTINPTGGIVSATPDGGMVAFPNYDSQMTPKDIVEALSELNMKPKFGKFNGAYFETDFDTKGIPQGNYMRGVDMRIKKAGY